jgi:release factor glutamine methyltransferase
VTAVMQHTLLEILKKGTAYLVQQRVPNARLDAEVLFANVLGLERIQLYVLFDRPMNQDELDRYKRDLMLRARGVPVAYIIGRREFMSLPISVGPGVLIPRPDTEILVEQAVEWMKAFRDAGSEAPRVIDMCTGSGAIACAIAHHAPWCRVLAADVSPDALKYAAMNIADLHLEDRVHTVAGDLFAAVPAEWRGADLVVSNPPYIPTQVLAGLEREIREHEPRIALDGGADGLIFYRRLAGEASAVLHPGGRMLVEVGDGQADDVGRILAQHGWTDILTVADYSGTPRVVSASPSGPGDSGGSSGSERREHS